MMLSVVFRYIDKNGTEKVSIGSMKFFEQKKRTCRQLIEICGWESTEEQWENLISLDKQDLYDVLCMILDDVLHVEHVN